MKKKRKGRGSRKGGSFERKLCKVLSLWWHGEREDIFWRSAGSGSRATVGKKILTGHGDICAVDKCGDALCKFLVIEAKNGYSGVHLTTLLDKTNNKKNQLEKWIIKAHNSRKKSKAFSWIIVHQRTRRACLVYFPSKLYFVALGANGPKIEVHCRIKLSKTKALPLHLVAMKLADFLEAVDPKQIKRLSLEHSRH
jgi:hypothetical protein